MNTERVTKNMNYQKFSRTFFEEVAAIRLTILSVFSITMLINHLVLLPEIIMACVASIFMILSPVLLGHDLLIFGKKYYRRTYQNLDIISKLILFWMVGSLFIFYLVVFCAFVRFDFIIVTVIVLLVLTVGSLRKNIPFMGIKLHHFLKPQQTNEPNELEPNGKFPEGSCCRDRARWQQRICLLRLPPLRRRQVRLLRS